MSRETAGDESDALGVLAELLHGQDLSTTQQRAVHDAIADSIIEGATPDRTSMLRLIELVAGRITFDQFKTQVLEAHTSAVDNANQEPTGPAGSPGPQLAESTLKSNGQENDSASSHTPI